MWAAGRAIRLGVNPYDPVVIASILYDALKTDGQILNSWPGGFMYPPWSLWIFFIFSLPPLGVAKYLWSLLACTSIVIVARQEFREKEIINHIPIIVFITASIAFLPLTKQVLFGQSSWIILIATYYSWKLFQKGNYRSAGILFGIAQVKSHVLLGFSAFMVARALRIGKPAFIMYFITTLAVQCGLAILLDGNAFTDFFHMIVEIGSTKPHAPRAATIDFLSLIFKIDIPRRLAMQLSFYGIIATLFIGMQGDSERDRDLALVLSLLTAPFCWVNDYLVLLPAYLGFMGVIFKYNEKVILGLAGILTLSGIWISGDWMHREVWGWAYLPLLGMYLLKIPQSDLEPNQEQTPPQPFDMTKYPKLNWWDKFTENLQISLFLFALIMMCTMLAQALEKQNYTFFSLIEVPIFSAAICLFLSLIAAIIGNQIEHLARYLDSSNLSKPKTTPISQNTADLDQKPPYSP